MDLEEVKGCLRALLSSSALSYQVNTLLSDFRESTGLNLPLFGYGSPVEFLRSLQDIVQLSGNPHNPKIALVESKKSAHIISLVDKQKSGKPRTNNSHPNKQKRLVVPAKGGPGHKGLTMNNALSSNPSSVQRPGNSVTNSTLFTSISTQSFSCSGLETQFNQILMLPKTNTYFNVPPQPPAVVPPKEEPISLEPNLQLPFAQKATSAALPNKSEVKKGSAECFENEKTDSCYFEDVSDSENCLSSRSGSSSDLATSASCDFVNSRVRNKLKKLIKNYPNGLWCCELPKLFLEEYHYELDYREFGYTSLIQMLSELPDVFRCLRPGKEDWILFDASASPSAEEEKIMNFHSRGNVFAEVRGNIQKLLAKYSGSSQVGVEVERMAELYEKTFGTPLNVESLGFKDMKSLLEMWEGSMVNLVRVGGKDFCSSAFSRYGRLVAEEALPPITADNDIFAEIFPKDAVGPEERLPQFELTRHIAVGQVVKVCVAEVWSPEKMFLQLYKFKNVLCQLMEEMQRFYGEHLNKYKMPESTIRPLQVCVGLYNADPESPEEWHRGQILKVINEKTVLIHFVDFGTVTRLKKTQLRFMHRNFQSFPMQALGARLVGIALPEGRDTWPVASSKRLLELSNVPYLHAELVDIDFKTSVLDVILSQPNQKSSINRVLVQEKLAKEDLRGLQVEEEGKDRRGNCACAEEETKGPEEPSSGALSPANDSFSKNAPEITDQFLDVDDLSHSTLFQFKTKNSPPPPSESSRNESKYFEDIEVTDEFDEIPDLNKSDEETEAKETPSQADPLPENHDRDAAIPTQLLLPAPEDTNPNTPTPAAPDKPLPPAPHHPLLPPQAFLMRPKRLPPGLEYLNPLSDLSNFPFLFHSEELKKRKNLLALDLLANNHNIKQVGANDPALALRIATQMAEAYIASQIPVHLPICHSLYPLFPGPFVPPPLPNTLPTHAPHPPPIRTPPAPPTPHPPRDNSHSSLLTHSEQGPPPQPPPKAKPSSELVEETRVAGRSLHLVKVEGELYVCVEELIRQFTTFTSREVADRLLQIKKVKVEYRVLSKKSDGEVVQALKSVELPGVMRREKSKKLKIYLLELEKAAEFLEALGSRTGAFVGDVKELRKSRQEQSALC